ncbi:VanZ family protein [Dorea phocaeensis]|jgi:teicoplanin resistance protein|uniref:VanZ family protein n=1 Tax=Dorea phocaeensis TaxID=2040291 RepID=UPI000C77926C|nr:VanZ family protein [Dorea phocaeensis]
MDLYQILTTHNRPWSIREIVIFVLLLAVVAGFLLLWVKTHRITKGQAVAGLALYGFLEIVFASTVFTRTPGNRAYELLPFWSWREILFHQDWSLLQENVLNIILFVPIGILLFPLLRKITWKSALIIGLAISALIETSQLILCRGLFEWDDMIHNTLGCVLGYLVAILLLQKRCGRKVK